LPLPAEAPLQTEMTTSTGEKRSKAVDPEMVDLDLHPASKRSTYCCQGGASSQAVAHGEKMTGGEIAWPNSTDCERNKVVAATEEASGDW
jgi:hypothetical protein